MSPGQVLLLARGAAQRSKARRKRPGRLAALAKMAPSTATGKPAGRERVVIEAPE